MSIVLRQIFQRGRGTAPLVRPRPPAPFETGMAVATIEQPGFEQSFEIETAPFAPSVGPVSPPDTPMANGARPLEPDSSANPLREAAGAADQSGESETRLLPPAALETLAPRGVAAIDTAQPEAHPVSLEIERANDHAAEPTASADDTKDAQTGLVAGPNIAVARRSLAEMPAGSSQLVAAPSAKAMPPSATALAGEPSGGEPADRAVDAAKAAVMEDEPAAQQTPAARHDASSPIAESKTLTVPANPAHGDRIHPAAPPAHNSGPSPRSIAAPAPTPPPAIEIRIGRIDVTVPPPATPTAPRPAEVGMSLDAFIAETRQ
ncbi:hypothetical protein [Parerythrobacter lacustris]|uniref:Flagellar hook-length control protein FliK n=1 Tax=Parerythrobacter lacustris TaxID=2969984 RepID=A0ABT1XVI7_9SPHN|nr:hypothetical protein [Parerythrobacter lacustris]MCR2835282.1 hypothetical protein [Parerythrobacter lacustris]